ncbi:MAG: amidophosphoribosyltransferase [Candidatus Bathyarchaeia archaeon]
MKQVKEHCGVLGLYSYESTDISNMLINGLQSEQHRGQEAWGIAIPNKVYKRLGLVTDGYIADRDFIQNNFTGNCGIGHVRYSTKGGVDVKNAHPIEVDEFSIGHNGTISNYDSLIVKLKEDGIYVPSDITDTEVVAYRLSRIYKKQKNWLESFKLLDEEMDGAFCFTMVTKEGEIIACRDRRGFRPLCIGQEKSRHESNIYVIASESCVIDYLNARFDHSMEAIDVEPGTIVKIGKDGVEQDRFSEAITHAHCSFEYAYFSNPSSYLEGINIYEARENCGKELAKMYEGDIAGDVVIPIPDTARPTAIGFAEKAGILLREGLMKDRYRKRGSLRSFIEPTPTERERIIREMIPIKPIIDGKKVIVIDDSIVRGTTSKEIVRRLRTFGARKIQWFLAFPPIQWPCYQGIDFPTREELLVPSLCEDGVDLDEINSKVGKYLGVDFCGYIDISHLSHGVGIPRKEMCTSCITGDYSCLKNKPRFRTRDEMKG